MWWPWLRVLICVVAAGGVGACGSPATLAHHATASLPGSAQHRAAVSRPALLGAAFRTPTNGYGMFVTSGAQRCRAAVGETDNGGADFHALVPVTSWACDGNAPVDGLVFAGVNGFLYGPELFETHDAGKTWAPDRQPGAVLAVSAAGRSVWMVESDCQGRAGRVPRPCRLRLLQSADGGHSWTRVPAEPRALGPRNGVGEPAAGQTWLVRTGPSTAYLLGAPALNPRGRPDKAGLWYTANGGRSWSKRSLGCHLDAMSVVLSAAPDGTLIAVCAGQPAAGSQAKSVARSTDGGRTWSVDLPCPANNPACFARPLDFGYLGGIDAVTGALAFLSGARSSLLVTHDGGIRWQTVRPLIGDTSAWSGPVTFFNSSDGVLIAEGGNTNETPAVYHTADGGVHWSKVTPTIG